MRKWLVSYAAIFALLCVGFGIARIVQDVNTLTDSAVKTSATAQATMTDAARTIQVAGGTLNEIRDTMRGEQTTLTAANKKTIETMAGIDALVSQATSTLAATGNSVTQASTDLHNTLVAAQTTVGTANKTIADVDAVVSDARIAESLTQISDASAQLAQASGHANKILADGEKVSDHYEQEILKPVSFARRAAEYLLSFGSDARVLFQGK